MHIFRCPHFQIWNKVNSVMLLVTQLRHQKIRRRKFFHSRNLNCRSRSVFFYVGVSFWEPIVNFRWSKRYKNNFAASVHIKQVTQTYHKWPGKQIMYFAKGWTKLIIWGLLAMDFMIQRLKYDTVIQLKRLFTYLWRTFSPQILLNHLHKTWLDVLSTHNLWEKISCWT